MKTRRHELIHCTLGCPIETIVAFCKSKFRGLGNYKPEHSGTTQRERDIHFALETTAIRHFEFPGVDNAEPCLQQGFDITLDLFFGDWWKTDRFVHSDKERNAEISWFDAFAPGLLLGLLSGRMTEVAQLCQWVHSKLSTGSEGEDEEVVFVYFLIAEKLRGEPMVGAERLRKAIEKCRTKRPGLLLNAWDAAVAGDQPRFDKGMTESLKHFAKSASHESVTIVSKMLAQPQSVICLSAMHFGLKFPTLPEKLAAYLITRQSLGLET